MPAVKLTTGPARSKRSYKTWIEMRRRCRDPKRPEFKDYGGRGIVVCGRWLKFWNFFADMGERPIGMCAERVDNDRGYEPGNVIWATMKVQSNNRRSNRQITALGKTMTLQQWVEETGIDRETIKMRFRRGWAAGRVMTQPAQTQARSRCRPKTPYLAS